MASYSSSSIVSSHSWSNLPLDLLISIAERLLVRCDLLSFRFVCSDWRSAVPRPKRLPRYTTWVTCKDDENCCDFRLIRREINLSITLPFPSHRTHFLFASNGWLLFITHHYSYYLFDPVSQQKHWLPPLTRKKMRLGKYASNNRSTLIMAVVSMSRDGGVAVAGVAEAYDQMGDSIGKRFSFIEINEKEKSWHISRKSCVNRMIGIVGGGGDEKRFYAVDENWGLYLLEAGPLMRWRRFNLMLPKHISVEKRAHVYCCGLRERNDGYLEVQGICVISLRSSSTFLRMKVQPSWLCVYRKDANVYCDEKWTDRMSSACDNLDYIFIPRL
ncbi:hypothetical protein KSP39_PZI024428 [Platanthera zijinensis]|uniref:F-box domain-containing protein n=1 Tax=Platanthera zijinensis TaxID=2320716 RepID=A0AAP0FU68_9ASPA